MKKVNTMALYHSLCAFSCKRRVLSCIDMAAFELSKIRLYKQCVHSILQAIKKQLHRTNYTQKIYTFRFSIQYDITICRNVRISSLFADCAVFTGKSNGIDSFAANENLCLCVHFLLHERQRMEEWSIIGRYTQR